MGDREREREIEVVHLFIKDRIHMTIYDHFGTCTV